MLDEMKTQLKASCLMLLWLSLLTGLVYPLVVTALGQGLFPSQAGGSLLYRDGAVRGSALIGQSFASDSYFTGRPSVTAPFAYNAANSSGSNLAPTNPALVSAVREQVDRLAPEHPGVGVPMDLVTTSASGLDPDISPESAAWQIDRVAGARGLDRNLVAALVVRQTEGRLFGFWGKPRVNVVRLNLALDALAGSK